MDPVVSAALLSWDIRPEVIAGLLLAGGLFSLGWRRLHRRRSALAAPWRLASYLSGLAVLGLALMSPIDVLGGQLFYMHMIQHLLMVMLAPPLLLLANPFPLLLWGLPPRGRAVVAGWFTPGALVRQTLRLLTPPGLAWLLFIGFFLGWHDPNAYNAALYSDTVHDLEHVTFFGSAMLYWWHVIGAGPRLHGHFSRSAKIAFLLVTVPVNMAAGITIAFATEPLYTYYTTVPRFFGISVMNDQMLSGIIMWIPGSMMYIIAALVLIAGLVQREAEKAPLPETEWATDEAMLAPGWER